MKKCSACGRTINPGDEYYVKGKPCCETCALKKGLFPLGHTGALKSRFFIRDRQAQS